MDKKQFISVCESKLKLIRTEYGFSQDKMAVALGISKKTLVEIEKGRSSLGWTGSVALCAVFSGSDIIDSTFGGKASEIIKTLAFDGDPKHMETTSGGVWWQTIRQNRRYTIQQNIISQHYRLVTADGERIASSFELDDLIELFKESNKE